MNSASLVRAILDAGGYANVARQMRVTRAAVWAWVHTDRRVPAERVIELSRVIKVPYSKIRPDIYPEDWR